MDDPIFLYSSDLHGNEIQYTKLIKHALATNAQAIVIGGDIAPKGMRLEQIIPTQRMFFEQKLPELLTPVQDKIPVYLMMGNDDAAVNLDVLRQQGSHLWKVISEKRLSFLAGFEIVGYPYVPITPFGIKDWEKFDLTIIPPKLAPGYSSRKSQYRYDGYKSSIRGMESFTFTQSAEKNDSIQKDLENELYNYQPQKTVYVIHCPPNDTNLDVLYSRSHIGSFAVKEFIETRQPHLTLHGHIHETVEMSGQFRQNIGKTVSIASGNHNVGEELALIEVNLKKPSSSQRKII